MGALLRRPLGVGSEWADWQMKDELLFALLTVCRNCLALGGEVPSQAPKAKTSHLETKNMVITDGQNVFLEHLGLSKSH